MRGIAVRNVLASLGIIAVAAGALVAGEPDRPAQKWVADKAHSSIEFRTSHWGIVDIIGWFGEYEVVVYSDREDFSDAVIEAWVAVASVQMPNSGMAGNLRRMLSVQEYPDARFRSTRVRPLGQNEYEITGPLTLRGVTREITLFGTFNGRGFMPTGEPGFTLHTDLKRLDFGVGEEEILKAQQHPTLGYTVKVTCNIRLGFEE